MRLRVSDSKRIRMLFLVICLLIFLSIFTIRGVVTEFVSPIAIPLSKIATDVSDIVFWWGSAKAITPEDLKELYEDRNSLAIDKVLFEQSIYENTILKEELGFVERTGYQYVSASVLSKSIDNIVSKIIIDVGTDDGVELGSAVVMGEGIFVGKITSTGTRSSTITAVTDPNIAIAVSLLNTSRTIGVASGSVGDIMEVQYIPIDEKVSENDLVVTSGLETQIPSGLLVGIVSAVQQEIGEPFQDAVLDPIADVRRLSHVLVLIR